MAVLIPWPLTSLSSRSSSGFSADVGALPARAPAARTAPSSPTVLAFPFLPFRSSRSLRLSVHKGKSGPLASCPVFVDVSPVTAEDEVAAGFCSCLLPPGGSSRLIS